MKVAVKMLSLVLVEAPECPAASPRGIPEEATAGELGLGQQGQTFPKEPVTFRKITELLATLAITDD